jgi:hypothetical protein
MSPIFDELGTRPVINAAGTLTRLGGTFMLLVVWRRT